MATGNSVQQGSIAPPGAGVPVKVSVPPHADEGGSVLLVGSVQCAGLLVSGPVQMTVTYSDQTDWQNPPLTVAVTAPPDAQNERAFSLQLTASRKAGSSARTSAIMLSVSGSSAKTTAVVAIRPRT